MPGRFRVLPVSGRRRTRARRGRGRGPRRTYWPLVLSMGVRKSAPQNSVILRQSASKVSILPTKSGRRRVTAPDIGRMWLMATS